MVPDNDYNIIQPVENPQNVGALAPIDRRAEKRRQQRQQRQHSTPSEQQDLSDTQQNDTGKADNGQAGKDSIDYRA